MKILVVDDEADVQPLFTQLFRKEMRKGDVELNFALSGEEALSFLNTGISEVVLILSDINMPGMSGLELLQNIREQHPLAPPLVMMITAYGDPENLQRALDLGADDFLTKPLDFNKLKEKIRNIEYNG